MDPVARPAAPDFEKIIQANNNEADSWKSVGELDTLNFTPTILTTKLDAIQQSVPVRKTVSHIDSRAQSTIIDLKDALPWINVARWKRLYAWRLVSYLPKVIQKKEKEIVRKFWGRKKGLCRVHESKCDADKILEMDLETIARVWDGESQDSEGELV